MLRHISYFDPRVVETDPNGQFITVSAYTDDEFNATIAAISNPDRHIPQDSITIELVPEVPEITLEQRNRADIDYIAIMTGVEL